MPGLTLCPVCGARLVVPDAGELGDHRDRRWDPEEIDARCPASGQTVLEAVGTLRERPPIAAPRRAR